MQPHVQPRAEPDSDAEAFLLDEEPEDRRSFSDALHWVHWAEFEQMLRRYEEEQ